MGGEMRNKGWFVAGVLAFALAFVLSHTERLDQAPQAMAPCPEPCTAPVPEAPSESYALHIDGERVLNHEAGW